MESSIKIRPALFLILSHRQLHAITEKLYITKRKNKK